MQGQAPHQGWSHLPSAGERRAIGPRGSWTQAWVIWISLPCPGRRDEIIQYKKSVDGLSVAQEPLSAGILLAKQELPLTSGPRPRG
jgi:hypothetical protein